MELDVLWKYNYLFASCFEFNHKYALYEDIDIVNFVSSSYPDFSSSYKRQVYISRVTIYDESMNLIGVATLSNPILKEEDQDISFKIRLDI